MLKCSRGKEEFSDSADTLTAEIDDFDLGMSASFIDGAPTPVVRLLSNDPGTTITNMRIVGYHTTMLGLSTRRSCQINKPRRWHTRRSWQGPSLLLVRMPGKSTRAICAHIATPKTPKSTPRYCWRNKRTPSWPISTPLRMQLFGIETR